MNNSSEPRGIPGIRSEAGPVVDADRVARTAARHAALAARVLPLPNLALRAGVTLLLLYGLLGLLMMMVSLTGLITPAWALGLGVAVAVLQYLFGPWMLDATLSWLYRLRWVTPEDLDIGIRPGGNLREWPDCAGFPPWPGHERVGLERPGNLGGPQPAWPFEPPTRSIRPAR